MKFSLIFKIVAGISIIIVAAGVLFFMASFPLSDSLKQTYQQRESSVLTDRHDRIISIAPNTNEYYAIYVQDVPEEFREHLINNEDKYFYYHPGFNPISILRAIKGLALNSGNIASSTITQQLVKNLLSNENDRSFKNKITELVYAVAIEMHSSKEDVLRMYYNSLFLGNSVQGIESASQLYFNHSSKSLTSDEIFQLLATISNPSNTNPFTLLNSEKSEHLAAKFDIDLSIPQIDSKKQKQLQETFYDFANAESSFELGSLITPSSPTKHALSLDSDLTEKIRGILKRNIRTIAKDNVANGAVVVLKQPENRLLAIVGSPSPEIDAHGYKINMATQPRAIGSTVKPFIYMKGFEKGLRPYTIVEDKEYKYIIGTGFALYPKNYDYQYHGEVNLHYALSNSLNVPAVKTLEYVGLDDFYAFLESDLKLKPEQSLENYQLGIALGSLEMDLLSLSYYFSLFANEGRLSPLLISDTNLVFQNLSSDFSVNRRISQPQYIQLVNKILSDRKTGVAQFGINSNLNLPIAEYAVKTGTSREYHDSWTIGYTPDFVVGAWIGNADESPMNEISGSAGAGRVWNEVMNLLISSEYYNGNAFKYDLIHEFHDENGVEYGLSSDDYDTQIALMLTDSLIQEPHNNDIFLLENDTAIPLVSSTKTSWYINDQLVGNGEEYIFRPDFAGRFNITTVLEDTEESITIFVENED